MLDLAGGYRIVPDQEGTAKPQAHLLKAGFESSTMWSYIGHLISLCLHLLVYKIRITTSTWRTVVRFKWGDYAKCHTWALSLASSSCPWNVMVFPFLLQLREEGWTTWLSEAASSSSSLCLWERHWVQGVGETKGKNTGLLGFRDLCENISEGWKYNENNKRPRRQEIVTLTVWSREQEN